ncbi:DUF6988 family protein [Rheinheimera sp. MM224]|uniref:DUF6988 family protein n=1 Tax=Rheinheimera sp. MM224 TaxID=3019969 RepID=UPI0021F8AD7A|nr:hypothetical protein [Rheinheimera sp. MM224]CAI3804185.1 hypothetical protein JAMGFMIE_03555 [Rheinheimera sp. MM224]
MYETKLNLLLPRCFEMYQFMAEHISHLEPMPELKYRLAFQSGVLCFEHGLATLKLITDDLASSGLGLMRLQYESLIRGMWFIYAANDVWFTTLSKAQTIGPEDLRKFETPIIAQMLKDLENSDGPKHILSQLNEFKAVTNSSINSFTHSGLLSIISSSKGYEPKLIYDAIRNANAIAAMNIQMMSLLTGSDNAIEPVRGMHHRFVDCLPIIH